jgi:L-threonylcarbamoyladenylate synthase
VRDSDVRLLERCLARDGVAVIPTDTVYGLACDPRSERAVARLYELKRRPAERPAAVMFFALERALAALSDLGEREQRALRALLPGPLTVLLPNDARHYPLACGPQPRVLGLRVPNLPEQISALAALERPLMQSSANLTGGEEARRLDEVAPDVRAGVDLELDGGELPGVASTVLDLTAYARDGSWRVAREGPVSQEQLARVLC